MKGDYGFVQRANVRLGEVAVGLSKVEGLSAAGRVALDVLERTRDLPVIMNLRCALEMFREANKKAESRRGIKFARRNARLLNRVERLLNKGKAEKAQNILEQYHQKKVEAGLVGPCAPY